MLDFANANRTGKNDAVVVVTDGHDDTCGSRSECQAFRDAIIRKSKATGIAIVTIGLAKAEGVCRPGNVRPSRTGSSKHGAAFWAQNPKQLATIIGSVHSYLSDPRTPCKPPSGSKLRRPVRSNPAETYSASCNWKCVRGFASTPTSRSSCRFPDPDSIGAEVHMAVRRYDGSFTSNLMAASCSGAIPSLRRNGSQRGSPWMLAKRVSAAICARPVSSALSSHAKAWSASSRKA